MGKSSATSKDATPSVPLTPPLPPISRMESTYRTWVHAVKNNSSMWNPDEIKRDLQTALGTTKWQLYAVSSLHRRYPVFQGILHSLFLFVDHRSVRHFCRRHCSYTGEVISEEYSLEYGTEKMEMHVGAVQAGDRALVVHDLIATGGTLCAAMKLLVCFFWFFPKGVDKDTVVLMAARASRLENQDAIDTAIVSMLGDPKEEAKKFKLGDPRSFHYLNQTNCYQVANVDDAREYLETRNAMDVVGISEDEQDAIFRVVAAILHLGNIDFVKGKEFDSSKLKDEKSLYYLQTAAELLMCNEKSLEDSLCQRVIVTPDGNITKPLDPAAAVLSRDALAKTIYSRLFDWRSTCNREGNW